MGDYGSRVLRTFLQALVPVTAAIGADLAADGSISSTGFLVALGAGLTVLSTGVQNLAEYTKEKYGHRS